MTDSADPDQLASLDLHCLLRQGMSCSAREGLIWREYKSVDTKLYLYFVLISVIYSVYYDLCALPLGVIGALYSVIRQLL